MSTKSEREYVLGTDELELERLGLQHRRWVDTASELWRTAEIGPGSRVLDVGCGPGYASLDLAQLVGHTGRVVGVDLSGRFIDEAARRAGALGLGQAAFVEGDVGELGEMLGENGGAFDAAYARWVLCFAPDTAGVLEKIAERVRPGGRVIVQDYFNYRAFTAGPHDPRFTVFQRAVEASWRDSGGNPDVVGIVPGILQGLGFKVEVLRAHQRVCRPGEALWARPDTWVRSFGPRLVESGHMSEGELGDLMALWAEMSGDASRFLVMPFAGGGRVGVL